MWSKPNIMPDMKYQTMKFNFTISSQVLESLRNHSQIFYSHNNINKNTVKMSCSISFSVKHFCSFSTNQNVGHFKNSFATCSESCIFFTHIPLLNTKLIHILYVGKHLKYYIQLYANICDC